VRGKKTELGIVEAEVMEEQHWDQVIMKIVVIVIVVDFLKEL
jgi:hypothetical protein